MKAGRTFGMIPHFEAIAPPSSGAITAPKVFRRIFKYKPVNAGLRLPEKNNRKDQAELITFQAVASRRMGETNTSNIGIRPALNLNVFLSLLTPSPHPTVIQS